MLRDVFRVVKLWSNDYVGLDVTNLGVGQRGGNAGIQGDSELQRWVAQGCDEFGDLDVFQQFDCNG
jgi:hypothetical protein